MAWLPSEYKGLGDLTPALPLLSQFNTSTHGLGNNCRLSVTSLHTYYTSLVISATDTVRLPLPVSIYIKGRDSHRRSKHKQYI